MSNFFDYVVCGSMLDVAWLCNAVLGLCVQRLEATLFGVKYVFSI